MRDRSILQRSHWVFDLDGTLTLAVHDFNWIRQELQIPDGVDILAHLASLPGDEARPLFARLDRIEQELAHRTSAAPGALRLLESLRRRGVLLGILTRNSRENALRTLELIGARDYFSPQDVIGRDEAFPKPDPAGLSMLAARWGAKANQVVMVGDYLFDLQTGRAAGTATIHVDQSRVFPWPELTDLGVGTLDELVTVSDL